MQPGNGETSEEIQGEVKNKNRKTATRAGSGRTAGTGGAADEQQPQEQQTPGEQEMPVVQSEELTVSISAVNSSAHMETR